MSVSSNRILIFTPVFPKIHKGASEQDEIYGALQLQALGHQVRLAAFLPTYQIPEEIMRYAQTIHLDVVVCPYPLQSFSIQEFFTRLRSIVGQPGLLDGSAYQHGHPDVKRFVSTQIETFAPDIIWLDNNFLWPIAEIAKKKNIPVIIRSQNFEPQHLLDESGLSLTNSVRYLSKYFGEIKALKLSTIMVAITPREQGIYKRLSPNTPVEMLPLRGLPYHLRPPHPVNNHAPLNIFFWGSTYNVSHNRAALSFVIKEIAPHLRSQAPHQFRWHIIGGKVPKDIAHHQSHDIVFHGYVDNLESLLDQMDIAVVPSLQGCGMQQKIFEPLTRGFPTITNQRGLAGYPFENGIHVLLAKTAREFTQRLLDLRSISLRQSLAEQASKKSHELFTQDRLDEKIHRILKIASR